MNIFDRLLDVLKNPQTYKEIAYLLLCMPFGVAYFVILVTGFSLGAGLAVLGVGILIIALMMALGRAGGWIEAMLARHLLGANIEPSLDLYYDHSKTFIANVGRTLTDGKAIRSLVYLGLKFPLGIFTFVTTVVALSVPTALIAAPLLYQNANINLGNVPIDTPLESIGAMLVGLALLPISLGAIKILAMVWRKLAEAMLDSDMGTEKAKRKQKRDTSHLMDDYVVADDYADGYGYYMDEEREEAVVELRQLLQD